MTKLKLKPNVKRLFSLVIILLFISFIIISVVKNNNYKNSNIYKLTELGYTKEEAQDLNNTLTENNISYILNNEYDLFYINLLKEKYYIDNNFLEYTKYYQNNKDINTTEVIKKINTLTNYEFYENTINTDINKNELMLVNKYYKLNQDYTPKDLISVPLSYAWGEKDQVKLNKDAYNAFLNMWNAAKNDNIYLMIKSAYRTYDEQKEVYDSFANSKGEFYADKIAARAGHSEHQTGYAIDVYSKDNSNRDTFKDSESSKWLENNAYKYGFILRYKKEEEKTTGYQYESWHYRYVGTDASVYIYENNITFEEYYAYFLNN